MNPMTALPSRSLLSSYHISQLHGARHCCVLTTSFPFFSLCRSRNFSSVALATELRMYGGRDYTCRGGAAEARRRADPPMMASLGGRARDVYAIRLRFWETCSALCLLLTAHVFSGPPRTQALFKRRGSVTSKYNRGQSWEGRRCWARWRCDHPMKSSWAAADCV